MKQDPGTGRPRPVVVAVFLAAGAAGVALSASVTSGPVILEGRWGLLAGLALWALAWAVAVATALRLPTRLGLVLILGAGLALRVAALGDIPTTSDDLYRYDWDARVQEAGINPYLHPPEDDELAGLRDPWLWPDEAGCAELDRPPGCTRINRPAVPTIYPPLAQAWFVAVAGLSPDGARHVPWQVAGLVTEGGVLALLPVALGRWGGDRRWSVLYALCPAPVLEIVHNGHVDGLAIALVLGALVVVAPPCGGAQRRGTDGWRLVTAGALLGAAALVKLYPAVLLLALVGAGAGRRLPALARGAAGAVAVAVVAYLPHVLDVGWRVVGFLPGYLEEEDYVEGGRFLVASVIGLPPAVAGVVSVTAVTGVAVWVLVRRPSPPVAAAALIGALLLAASPVQPWYAVALLAVATVAVRPWWVAVLAAGYPYYFAVILDHPHAVALGRLAYGAALLVVVAAAAGCSRAGRGRRAEAYAEPIAQAPGEPTPSKQDNAARVAAAMVFALGIIVVVGPALWHLDTVFGEDPFAPGVETETVVRTAEDGTTTTERTTRPASPSALERTLAAGGLVVLRLGFVALAAFLAGAVVQRTLRANFAIEVGAGGIKVPPEVRQAASESAEAMAEIGAVVQQLARLVEGFQRDLQRHEGELVVLSSELARQRDQLGEMPPDGR